MRSVPSRGSVGMSVPSRGSVGSTIEIRPKLCVGADHLKKCRDAAETVALFRSLTANVLDSKAL